MKFGKNFYFWLQILLAIIKALLGSTGSKTELPDSTGPRLVKSVLDVAANSNEDDSHTEAPPIYL